MKTLGKITLIIVGLIAISYAVSYAGKQGWLANTPLKDLNYDQLDLLEKENLKQTKVLTERAKDTGEHVQKILGDTVEVDEKNTNKSLHEKTLEYAKYLYCKQVVNDWESTNDLK